MADAPATEQIAPKMRVLGQFVRDMSFENIMAQKGLGADVQPDVQVAVNLDAQKRTTENTYDSSIKLKITFFMEAIIK